MAKGSHELVLVASRGAYVIIRNIQHLGADKTVTGCLQTTIHNLRDWCCQMVKKLIFGLLATITLKVVYFHAYAPFPALQPLFKCILEVMFCE
jgi:hypothetical protein